MSGAKAQKIMVQPIHMIFRLLQSKKRVNIWVAEQLNTTLEGQIIGFDEFMNLVLDDAVEVSSGSSRRTELGRILLKGENIVLLTEKQE
ncbi:hypothetical protein MP638_006566 [Amoeboaphelidium occidentale]|nr:hypothetical protein MP638_006566 [Amoeboaphelidium occidentale]